MANLGDVAEFNPKHAPDSDRNQIISFVPMPAVDEFQGSITAPVDRPLREVWSGYTHFADGDVIFAKITPCMENGKAAIVAGMSNGLACGSTEFFVLRPNDAAEASYIWRYIRQQSFRADAERNMIGAVGQRRVPRLYLETRPIALPPKAEQRRIVAKLDMLTERLARARAELGRVPVLARNLRQSALYLAQFGSLTRPWRKTNRVPLGAAAALEAVRGVRAEGRKPIRRVVGVSHDFPLPDTWVQISPDELAADAFHSIGIGPFGSDLVKADYRDSGTRLVFVRDIRAQQFGEVGAKYVNGEKAEKLKAHAVEKGDLLVTKMGDPPGDVALFNGDAQAIITADCIKLRAHSQLVEPGYLLFCLRFPCVQAQIRAATKGVAQQKISLDSFRRMVLPIPPIAEQRQIAMQLRTAFARADRLEAEATRARALLDRLEAAILAKAFRGELVPQDPDDEPASVLLDRIRAERAAAPKPKRGRARKAVG